jgi:Xaa-Pro aminopeptidase
MKALPLAGAAAALPAAGVQAQPAPLPPPDGRLTLNRERATRFMQAHDLQALIGALDTNARYLTNMDSLTSRMGPVRRSIGVLPADPGLPVIAIVPAMEIGRHTAPDREWPEIVTYSLPADAEPFRSLERLASSDEVPALGSRVRTTGGDLTARERAWAENEVRLPVANAATPELAVRKVLANLGLTRARVGIDDAGLTRALDRLGLDELQVMPADNLFLRIRQVKSPVEIARMRRVSALNSAVARATMATFQPGMTNADIEAQFIAEVARRGGVPKFIAAGMVSGLRHGELVRHEPCLVDCVASFDGYVGDFARTAVLGTPPPLLEQRARLTGRVAEELVATLRPGLLYSDIRARGREMLKKLGGDFAMGIGPHGVGLQHSEDPWRDDLPFQAREDVRLEAGMVITVDLPTLEPGWGSMHMESLILITPDGAEWMDRIDDPLYQI